MGMFGRKLWLICWKNYVLRKRHWFLTLLEVVLPTVLFSILMLDSEAQRYHFERKEFDPMSIEEVMDADSWVYESLIYYSPSGGYADKLVNRTATYLSSFDERKVKDIQGFRTEENLIYAFRKLDQNTNSFSAIIFDQALGDTAPKHLTYKIRSPHWINTVSLLKFWAASETSVYMRYGVIQLQMALEKVYSDDVSKDISVGLGSEVSRHVLQFPSPPHTEINIGIKFIIVPLFFVISFCTLSSSVLKRVVEEKETGVRELMKLMGLEGWMLWTGWLINSLFLSGISITIITVLLTIPAGGPVLSSVEPLLLWIFLMIYCATSIFFMFFLSAFFSRPMLAMTFGLLMWFLSFFLFVFIESKLPVLSMCLLPNMALFYGTKIILTCHAQEIKLGWGKLFSVVPTGDISMATVWLMMAMSNLLFGFVRYYVESVMPGRYGIAKPWHFLFTEWVCYAIKKVEPDNLTASQPNFEPVGANLVTGIRAREVRKVYQKFTSQTKKVAVDGVSIDIYRNNITALLGHNGAGKTTFMSILAGMFSPSSGTVEVEGHDAVLELSKVRESLGLCPQHNMHFTDLTVTEHLVFFGLLKGLSRSEANMQATVMLKKLNLNEKKDVLSYKLSGGMKRKLSLGLALVGESKVLLLDEPTAGMDPEFRRQVWDMLLTMRDNRTIVITTHFMEEADVLGDRIAIMDHGKVRCYGTSIFLKKLYGAGYHLLLTKSVNFKEEDVTEVIRSKIPEVVVGTGKGPLQSYTLPSHKISLFPKLFDGLERDKDKLGITSIGVSVTTMEDVFLKVGELDAGGYDNVGSKKDSNEDGVSSSIEESSSRKLRGFRLLLQQMKVLMISRIYYTCQFRMGLFFKMVLPALIMVATLQASEKPTLKPQSPHDSDDYVRAFDLVPYAPSEVLLKVHKGAELVASRYEALVKAAGSHVRRTKDDLVQTLKAEGDADYIRYFHNFVVAAEVSETNVTALYSGAALHSLPASIQLLTNSLLFDRGRVTGAFQMISSESSGFNEASFGRWSTTIVWTFLAPLAFLLSPSLSVAFPLRQRVSRVKQLQAMAGVVPTAFWAATLLWDLAQYLVGAGVALFVLWQLDEGEVFAETSGVVILVAILVAYGVAALAFSYLWSFAWASAASAFAAAMLSSLITGMVGSAALVLPDNRPGANLALQSTIGVVPYFTLSSALGSYSETCFERANCRLIVANVGFPENGLCAQLFPFRVWSYLFWLLGDAAILISALMLIDHRLIGQLYCAVARRIFPAVVTPDTELDVDVLAERRRVMGSGGGDVLLVDGLVLNYKSFTAVKSLSFGVGAGECFGLLGVNGAGKTSTFAALTGALEPRAGNVFSRGCSLRKRRRSYLSSLSYCPQTDAVEDHLTVRQNIEAMALLRGMPPSTVRHHTDEWMAKMDLCEYAATRATRLSGGTRRKLCAAMALVAAPGLVFLDEPTAGVDPASRRRLWTALRKAQSGGQSVVLTSHSMDECEALCGRIGIMVAGQLRGIGHQQHLKRRYGTGFTLTMKVNAATVSENLAQAAVAAIFGACELCDAHQGLLRFHLSAAAPWSRLFADAEKLQRTLPGLEDYSLSDTTLEEVFLSFARTQY